MDVLHSVPHHSLKVGSRHLQTYMSPPWTSLYLFAIFSHRYEDSNLVTCPGFQISKRNTDFKNLPDSNLPEIFYFHPLLIQHLKKLCPLKVFCYRTDNHDIGGG